MELLNSPDQPIRIAVISDIHAYSSAALEAGERRPSFVEISSPSDIPGVNPFRALDDLVDREELEVDILVCCGDIGDKAHPEALTFAWSKVQALAKRLKAKTLLVASGNHDMDSRFKHNDHDARSVLLGLPQYPFDNDAQNNEYWARNLVVKSTDQLRYVVLNSSAYHGYQDEYPHGRVSTRTLQYLKNQLDADGVRDLNLLVSHHHPRQVTSIDLADKSEMTNGSALLDLLDSGEYGRWIMIHGHRHFPYISYGPGTAESTVVFSAGAFSAILYDEIAGKARNQFYVLELASKPTGRVRGTFRAWDWISDEGFEPAQSKSGLPHRGGFGAQLGGSELADAVVKALGTSTLLTWDEMTLRFPEVAFVAPRDLRASQKLLAGTHGIRLIYSEEGVPLQVGRS